MPESLDCPNLSEELRAKKSHCMSYQFFDFTHSYTFKYQNENNKLEQNEKFQGAELVLGWL